MEEISLRVAPKEFKEALVRSLGYETDGTWVLRSDGERLLDEYANKPVRLDRMLVFPGSVVILDDNPLSIASYFEDHGDLEEEGGLR